ncbi:hypothetical protein GALMADRAFT_129808 [Galerina marginata CBS 339.88]|uniref:Protein BFR2 n=1 Tax=Galerina marginata (strain CBS 339.88) TaxID=685588 RepID=A0A067SDD3_GALM3|nr:hypothetical protein GALMADRAFT_129808 [Galerina marginata CBS 339.88]
MPVGRISLAEQIAQLEEAAPVDYDPEDLQSRGAEIDDAMHMDASGSREHYVEVGPSSLRNRLPSIAHPKYEGVRASRKQLLEESDDAQDDEVEEDSEEDGDIGVEDEDMDSDEGEGQAWERGDPRSENEEEELSESEEMEQDEAFSNEPRLPATDQDPIEDVASALKQTRVEDLKKGEAVKRQIALWDTLLDTRIRMQKSVVSANRLPPPSAMKSFLEASECQESISKLLNEASLLSNELFELQENLLTINDIVKPPPPKRRKLDPEASVGEYREAFSAATEDIVTLEHALHPWTLQTLSKWSSKIQAVTPSVLLPSNRGAFLKGGQNLKSVVELIEENLADHDKLLARTRVARVKTPRIGTPQEQNAQDADTPDPEIFDDTDFYQKLLRDIIDARGNGGKNEDWMVLQKQKKAKKKVDTKASKGRKLRYEVHEKLQNFMVPVPSSGTWHEEQIDELFSSLLGKGFEHIPLNAERPLVQENLDLTGFRVFG